MMVVGGYIHVAAATCPPATVIEGLFRTLLCVRQAEFEHQAGVIEPNVWDTGVAKLGVPIYVDRQLSDTVSPRHLGDGASSGRTVYCWGLTRRVVWEGAAHTVCPECLVMVRGLGPTAPRHSPCRPSRHPVRLH